MKNILIFLALISFSIKFYAQKKAYNEILIDYKETGLFLIDSIPHNIPIFKNVDQHYIPNDQYIQVSKLFPLDFLTNASSFAIESVEYEQLPVINLGELLKDKLPTKLEYNFAINNARNLSQGVVSLMPIINDNGIVKYVKRIRFSYTEDFRSREIQANMFSPTYNSVLVSGDYYKFYIEKSGVYKISRSEFQNIFGTASVDPRTIKIYGLGGKMLPLANATSVPFDLVENAIEVIGEQDGIFDAEDYILFYAEGVDKWDVLNNTSINLYDSKAYYYITASNGMGKRINAANQPLDAAQQRFMTYQQIDVYEKDLINVGRLGRKWVGENFNVNNSRDFVFNMPNLLLNQPIEIEVLCAAASLAQSQFIIKANNNTIGSMTFSALNNSYHVSAYENLVRTSFIPSGVNNIINISFNNNGVPTANGYLDFIKLTSVNELKGYGKQFLFYNDAMASQTGVAEFQITNASGIQKVWDITDLYNITSYTNTSGSPVFNFKVSMGENRNFVAIDPTDFYKLPTQNTSRIANQNLKGTIFKNNQNQFQDIDYIIITTPEFLGQANRLATLHRTQNNYNVKVVDVNHIYNEFSSGQKDIAAIRNFMRYIYFNASSPDKRVKYLNLFGTTSYDYKNIVPNNVNIVPTFEYLGPVYPSFGGTSINFSNYSTFMSDDFFGLMDDNEGNMQNNIQQGIDIAVGRMLFRNLSEAQQMVDKVYAYYDKSTYGRWRNELVMLADDVDAVSDLYLQSDLNAIAESIEQTQPFFNIKKIYMDAYQLTVTAGGNRYIDAKRDFVNAFNAGALLINYYGHGNETVLSSERVFEISDVNQLENTNKLPVFITITCEVGRFDNPYVTSLGELIYRRPQAGAIAMLTTTREIGINAGRDINKKLSEILFNPQNQNISIGEALRLTKNNFSNLDRNVVFCVGDPALKMAIPSQKVVLTQINDKPIDGTEDVLQALSYTELKGELQDEFGNFLSNFSGDLAVQIFDKEIERITLGNKNIVNPSTNQVQKMNFQTLGETVFKGNASITDGVFKFGFVVPKDIKMNVGPGKVSFYAKNTDITTDKTGFNQNIRIGGINLNAPVDKTPPLVKLYMNEMSFTSGGTTNASPVLLAFLEDENGINTASGIGHDIVAILDGNEMAPYILNDFYETELDNYKKGKIRFPLSDLSPGLHTITFKAWDVYNNPVIAEIQFFVIESENVVLSNVLNYPNPFVSYTEFWFTHNRPFEPLQVQVQIMTITGKVVKTINDIVQTEGFLSRSIKWDGRDDFGDKLAKGVYVYRLTVKSTLTNKKSEKIEKLVIL